MPADYILTGALSPLGRHIIARLDLRQCRVVGIDRPEAVAETRSALALYAAEPCDREAMQQIFRAEAREYTVVIHCADRIALTGDTDTLFDIHRGGTDIILDLCRAHAVRRLVYVGSSLSLAAETGSPIAHEPDSFRPGRVQNRYGQCVASACAAVAEAADEGLDCVIALVGECVAPVDATDTLPVNRLIRALSQRQLHFGVGGGLELVDVRDAAQGVLLAADKGISGRSYILSGQYVSLRELFALVREQCGTARLPILPLALARWMLPAIQAWDGEHPLYNARALTVLRESLRCSHARAERELGYASRPVRETISAAARFERERLAAPTQPCLPPLAADAH